MSKLANVERQARALMTAHGVGSLAFEFDRGKRRIGATHFVRIGNTVLPKKITISRHFAEILSDDEIRETMLHEIAHALAGHAAGHGPRWQAEARKLGIKGDRCKATSAAPEKSVKGWCPVCEKVAMQQHRLPLRVYWHAGCGSRNSPLRWFKDGKAVHLDDMPQRFRSEYARLRGMAG